MKKFTEFLGLIAMAFVLSAWARIFQGFFWLTGALTALGFWCWVK